MLQKNNKINWIYSHFLTHRIISVKDISFLNGNKVISCNTKRFNLKESIYELFCYVAIKEKNLNLRYAISLHTCEHFGCRLETNQIPSILLSSLIKGKYRYQVQGVRIYETCRNVGRAKQNKNISIFMENCWIVRPLLSISRFEINKICFFWQLPIFPDTSNQKVKFLRNRVRKQLLPAIKFFFNSRIENVLLQFADIVEIDHQCLDQITKELFKNCVSSNLPLPSNSASISKAHSNSFCFPLLRCANLSFARKESKVSSYLTPAGYSTAKHKLCFYRTFSPTTHRGSKGNAAQTLQMNTMDRKNAYVRATKTNLFLCNLFRYASITSITSFGCTGCIVCNGCNSYPLASLGVCNGCNRKKYSFLKKNIVIKSKCQKILVWNKKTNFLLKILNYRISISLVGKKFVLSQKHMPFLYTSISKKKKIENQFFLPVPFYQVSKNCEEKQPRKEIKINLIRQNFWEKSQKFKFRSNVCKINIDLIGMPIIFFF